VDKALTSKRQAKGKEEKEEEEGRSKKEEEGRSKKQEAGRKKQEARKQEAASRKETREGRRELRGIANMDPRQLCGRQLGWLFTNLFVASIIISRTVY
jgi:hypothetical protein